MNPIQLEAAILSTAFLSQALHQVVDAGANYLLESYRGSHLARVWIEDCGQGSGEGPTPKAALEAAAYSLVVAWEEAQARADEADTLKEAKRWLNGQIKL